MNLDQLRTLALIVCAALSTSAGFPTLDDLEASALPSIIKRLTERDASSQDDRKPISVPAPKLPGCTWSEVDYLAGSRYLRDAFPDHAFFQILCIAERGKERKAVYALHYSTGALTLLQKRDPSGSVDRVDDLITLARENRIRLEDESQVKEFVRNAVILIDTPSRMPFVCGNSKFGNIVTRSATGWEYRRTVDGGVNYAWRITMDGDGLIVSIDRDGLE
jgi:hypothetical protein